MTITTLQTIKQKIGNTSNSEDICLNTRLTTMLIVIYWATNYCQFLKINKYAKAC